MSAIAELHARNVAEVNARMAAEGCCVMHNPGTGEPATHLVELPCGNVLPMSEACVERWEADRAESGDPLAEPVSIRRIEDL